VNTGANAGRCGWDRSSSQSVFVADNHGKRMQLIRNQQVAGIVQGPVRVISNHAIFCLWIVKASFRLILWKRKQKYGTLEEQTGDLIIMRVELKENGKKTNTGRTKYTSG
jgi:hypothetical protein